MILWLRQPPNPFDDGKRERDESEKLRSTYQRAINLHPLRSATTASSFHFSYVLGCVFLPLDLVYDLSSTRLGICLDHPLDESPLSRRRSTSRTYGAYKCSDSAFFLDRGPGDRFKVRASVSKEFAKAIHFFSQEAKGEGSTATWTSD